MPLSIIIPTLNEADCIADTLQSLQSLRQQGHEVIVVDGGSDDGTGNIAQTYADQLIQSGQGRAQQMNAGAAVAQYQHLLFLHADTQLPSRAADSIAAALQKKHWGRFNIRIDGHHWLLPVIAFFINLRSFLTGIATGDQAIFVHADWFNMIGGFPAIALMEDIALARQLRKLERPACLSAKVTTSGRRWEKHGVIKTILLMWTLRLAYYLGVAPSRLNQFYAKK